MIQLHSYSQVSWNRSIDYKNESNYGISVFESDDSNLIVGVLTYPENVAQGAVLKVGLDGVVRWKGGIVDSLDGFYISGSYEIFGRQIWSPGLINQNQVPDFSQWISSFNTLGEELWRRKYDFSPFNVNFNRGIRMWNDSTAIVFFDGYHFNDKEEYIHKHGYLLLDSLGTEKYRKWLPTEYDISLPHDYEPFPGGGYMLSVLEIEQGQGVPFEYPLTIKRLDDTFGVVWEKVFPNEEAAGGKFALDNELNIYMTWAEDPSDPGTGSPLGSPSIISYDMNGDFRWKYTFDNNPRHRILGNIIVTTEGNIVATGLDEPGFPPLQWGWLVSLDRDGNLLWDRKFTIKDISPNFGGFFGDLSKQPIIVW